MGMFWEFFQFELKFRLKSLSTYVYFFIWVAFAFLSVASESFGPVANQNGKVLLNGPWAISLNLIFMSLFSIIVFAAIFGTSILRDFQRDTFQILFTKPISKFAYLGGRWSGSFVVTILIGSGMILGLYLGTFAPWADHARIGPNHLGWYVQPFLTIVVVQTFFCGSLFFMVAALTRKIFIVYLQGVALFMVYLIGFTVFFATRSLEHFWSGVFDPIGVLYDNAITKYWTVDERNTLLLPLDFSGHSPGVFLYNRILWIAVGLVCLLLTWKLFPMSVEALTARAQGRRAAKAQQHEEDVKRAPRSLVVAQLPRVKQSFGARTTWLQYRALTRLRLRAVVRDIPFWALVALMIVFGINNGAFAGRVSGQNVWPVTNLMLQSVEGSAVLFLFIVAGLYAAELLWRERDNRFDGIQDALPLPEFSDWLSRLTAIVFIEVVLLAVAMLVGILMQSLSGYYHFELGQYLKELYLIVLPQTVGFAMFALFVQTMVSNKFVGHAIVIGTVVVSQMLPAFGWENTLYLPGNVPQYKYSDMNGYGHFVPSILWSLLYWTAVYAVLGVISIAFARRGISESWRARVRLAAARAPRLAAAGLLFFLIACGSGGWYYYNAHVLNEFLTADDGRQRAADYERNFKKYEDLPQPKVTAVDTEVNIYPERRAFEGSGRFTLQNKSSVPIKEIQITDRHETVRDIKFDRPFHLVSRGAHDVFSIYALDQPLAPGEVVTLQFKAAFTPRGFKDGHERPEFALNGTFFDMEFLPEVGYDATVELDDPRRRREQHLGEQKELPPRGDATGERTNLFTTTSDWITYHTVVSTSADQIAIAPGYLTKRWSEAGRNYFDYSMGSTHILDFFSYLSGRYQVRKEVYQGVSGPINLEVYYDPAHTYDIDEMLESSREGLKYYEQHYSPYQFSQFRIMEFPLYRTFAQSFSNTVPFSEGIGFITRVKNPAKDVDLTYFVTAHELGHQWWGHQLIGGRVEGSNMMSETLAQYSAYMVMKAKYGPEYMHRVMRHYLDSYLRGRAGEVRRERPLALVQNEPYVWYQKGGQIMYALADYIGEDKVDLALHNFLMQYRFANATNQQDAVDQTSGANVEERPYPDTRLLVDALRAQTPPEYQYLIDDGFNRIVLYDNQALSAVSTRRPDGKYEVKLKVQARKVQADGNGAETPMKMADYIDIGVFAGAKDEGKALHLSREKITQEVTTFTFVVDGKPTYAGIDPFNELIDRISDDNTVEVVESNNTAAVARNPPLASPALANTSGAQSSH